MATLRRVIGTQPRSIVAVALAALLTPAWRHAGDDHAIMAAQHAVYIQARSLNPARWSGATRNWSPVGAVTLNPERDSVVQAHSNSLNIQPLAA